MRRLLLLLLAACRTGLPGASLHGRVVVGGESPAGIVVSAGGPQAASTTTDDNGEYWLPGLDLGLYTLTVTVGSTVEGRREVTLEANGPVEVPELRFTPAGELEGRATRGGAPTGNAGILVSVEGTSSVGVTDDAGHYHIAGVPTGKHDLGAQLVGYRAARAQGQTVRWDEITQVPDLVLTVGAGHAALRGTALLHGHSDHSGTRVVVVGTGLETVTAADGSWAMDGVPEGTYAVQLDNGAYHETVPAVEALPGSDGFVIDESLYALERSPLTLFAARRFQATRASSSFALSPDGTRLLYGETLDNTLRSVPLDGSGAVTLAQQWWGNFDYYNPYAVFSPDSATVAFRSNDLELVPARGGTPTHVAYGAWTNQFAPVGGLLAYQGVDPVKGTLALFATSYPGGTPRMLASDAQMGQATWSADGSHLVYRTNIDEYWRLGTIRLVPSAGGPSVEIAGSAFEPIVRSDLRYALVLANVNTWDGTATLYSLDLMTGGTAQLGSQVGRWDGGPAFAGTTHVVYRQLKTLYSIPVSGGAATQLGDANEFKVSADGSRVAFTAACDPYPNPCGLWTVPTVGGTAAMVAPSVFEYGLSADGSQLWYMSDRDNHGIGTLWTTTVGGTPETVESGVYAWTNQFVSGGKLLYAKDVTSDSHGTLMLSGTALGRDVEMYSWQMSSDNQHLAFVEMPVAGLRSLWVAPLDGTPARGVLDNLAEHRFTKQGGLVARRSGSLPPYRFQDGFYFLQP